MTVPAKRRAIIIAAHGGVCHYCGDAATHVDHIVPRALGGTDDLGNLIAACRACNLHKHCVRLPPDAERRALAAAEAARQKVLDGPDLIKLTTLLIREDLFEAVTEYRFVQRHNSFNDAILDLIRTGLAASRA